MSDVGQSQALPQSVVTGTASAITGLNSDQVSRIEGAYRANPTIASNPMRTMALAGQVGGNAQQTQKALDYLQGQAMSIGHIQSEAGTPAGSSWWSPMVNGLHRAWSNTVAAARGAVTGFGRAVTGLASPAAWEGVPGAAEGMASGLGNAVSRFGGDVGSAVVNDARGIGRWYMSNAEQGFAPVLKGEAGAAKDLWGTAANVANRANTTLGELGDLQGMHGYQDALHTIDNLMWTPVNLVNPMSPNNGYQLMAHTAAYYESLANRYGPSYAVGYGLLNAAATMGMDGVLPETADAAQAAIAEQTAQGFEQQIASGQYLNEEQLVEYQRARGFVDRYNEGQQAQAAATARAAETTANRRAALASMNPIKAGVARATEFMGAPATALYRVARNIGAPMQDVRLNMLYQLTQAQALANHPDLWNKTRGGTVIQRDGTPVDLGRQTAMYMGIHPNTPLFSAVSGLTDIYSKFLGADPVGAVGKEITALRGTAGFLGGLGKWYHGLDLRSGWDVYKALESNRSMYNAFKFMADHNGAEIGEHFNGIGAGTYSPQMLRMLGDASTIPEVAQIHAEIADGVGMARFRAPTMGFYTSMKQMLRNGVDVHEALAASDYKQLKSMAKGVYDETGLRIATKDEHAMYIGNADAGLRYRTTMRKWFASKLGSKPMYYSELSHRLENVTIHPGDPASITAIMEMMRAAMMPETLVRASGDYLLRAPDKQAFVTAYRNVLYHMIMRRVDAGLLPVEADGLAKALELRLWDQAQRLSGIDGGGIEGGYVAGSTGIEESHVIGPNETTPRTAGTGSGDLGVLRLPTARDIDNVAKMVERELVMLAPNVHNIRDFSLERSELEQLATERELSVSDAAQAGSELHAARPQVQGARETLYTEDGRDVAAKAYARMVKRLSDAKTLRRLEEADAMRLASGGAVDANGAFVSPEGDWGAWNEWRAQRTRGQRYSDIYEYLREELRTRTRALNADSAARTQFDHYDPANQTMRMEARNASGQDVMSLERRERMKGETYALFDHLAGMNIQLVKDEMVDGETIQRVAESWIKDLRPDGRDNQHFVDALVKRIKTLRAEDPAFRNKFQVVSDGINRNVLSRLFVPLALWSGRWAIHVGLSETMLNMLRMGPFNFFESRVAVSIAKHELDNPVLHRGEAALIRGTVGRILTGMMEVSRSAASGAVLGLERDFLKALPKDQAERLLDDTVRFVMRNDGHLPGGVHQQETLYEANDYRIQATNKTVYDTGAVNKDGEAIMASVRYKAKTPYNYVDLNDSVGNHSSRALASLMADYAANRAADTVKRPITEALVRLMEGPEARDLGGIRGSDEWLNSIRERLTPVAIQSIHDIPPEELARYERASRVTFNANVSSRELAPEGMATKFTKKAIEDDWAHALVSDVIHSTFGGQHADRWVYNSDLAHAMTTDQRLPDSEMAKILRRRNGSLPSHVPLPGIVAETTHWYKPLVSRDFLVDLSNWGHDAILGPIVNQMVRDPVAAWEFHVQMEELRPLVDKGIITDAQAEVLAQDKAMAKMVRYVHNPKDKTIFEQNIRIASPFYFAKNQAWRRAARMMGDDPGAFEKYLKEALAVTTYVSVHSQGGQSPSITIPGSRLLGGTAGIVAPLSPGLPGMGALQFGLSGSGGSVSSIVPTGDLSGWKNLLGNFMSMPFGPVVTIPLKSLQSTLLMPPGLYYRAMESLLGAQKLQDLNIAIQKALGPIEDQSPLWKDIFPSSMVSDTWNLTLGLAFAHTTTYATTLNEVINNHLDEMFSGYVRQYMATPVRTANQVNASSGVAAGIAKPPTSRAADLWNAQFMAYEAVATMLNSPKESAAFLRRVQFEAVYMSVVKAVLNFASPLALSINEQFSKIPQFDAIAKEKNPNGTLKYPTFGDQTAEFLRRDPNSALDLVTHTGSEVGAREGLGGIVGPKFPETLGAVHVLQTQPEAVARYPYAVAYSIPQGGAYSPLAFQLELEMKLRQRLAPQDYINSILIALGDDLYYNYLQPALMRNPTLVSYQAVPTLGGGSIVTKQLNYAGYTEAEAIAKLYGRQNNPIWHDYFFGKAERESVSNVAYQQMGAMLRDPTVTFMKPATKQMFQSVYKSYSDTMAQINYYKENGASSVATFEMNTLYNDLSLMSKSPHYLPISNFITGVLMQMPGYKGVSLIP